MTLNITLIQPGFIVQVSDGRGTDSTSGAVITDYSNKMLLVRCADATLAISFTGVAKLGNTRIDMWLAERLHAQGAAELPAVDVVDRIKEAGTQMFPALRGVPVRHMFIVAGWLRSGSTNPRARVWRVTNDNGSDTPGQWYAAPSRQGRGLVVASGMIPALERDIRRRMGGRLRSAGSAEAIGSVMVRAVREAAGTSIGSSIGPNCTVTMLDPAGKCATATFHGAGPEPPQTSSATVLWTDGRRNLVAMDVALSSPNVGLEFGKGARPIQVMSGRLTGTRAGLVGTDAVAAEVRWKFGPLRHSPPLIGPPEPTIAAVRITPEL